MCTVCNICYKCFLLLIVHFINTEIKKDIFKLINNCSNLSIRLLREEINILL